MIMEKCSSVETSSYYSWRGGHRLVAWLARDFFCCGVVKKKDLECLLSVKILHEHSTHSTPLRVAATQGIYLSTA